MKMQALIKYGDGEAVYDIRRENPGIYSGTLVYYTGSVKTLPPDELTLVRGVRGWTGSCDDVQLLNDLGQVIIESLRTDNPHKKLNS